MEVDADDTGVLLILFLINVASLNHEEEKLLRMWGLFGSAYLQSMDFQREPQSKHHLYFLDCFFFI